MGRDQSPNSEDQPLPNIPMVQQRPLNLVQLPQFYSHAGTHRDQYIARFEIVCAANLIQQANFLHTFPTTLVQPVQEWFRTHGPFMDWDALKNAFLARFRRLAYKESLHEQLQTIRMGIGESVDSYYGRMEYLLQRWNNHQMPDDYLMRVFIRGLYPLEFRIAIKEKRPQDLATTLRYAKSYEEA